MTGLLYYITLKSIFNRIQKNPVMVLGIAGCVVGIILIPFLFLKEGYKILIPSNILYAFFCFYFSVCFFEMAKGKNTFKTVPSNIETLFIQVPEKTKSIFICWIGDTIIKSIFSYSAIFLCIKIYAKVDLFDTLCSLLIIIINITSLVLFSGIIDLVSLIEKRKCVKTIFYAAGILLVGNGLLELLEINITKNLLVSYLPPYLYGASLKYVLGGSILSIRIIICSISFLILLLSVFMALVYFIPIRAFHILNELNFLNRKENFIDLLKIENMIRFLPHPIRLLCAKEIVQIIREKSALLSVCIQTLVAGSIMIISAATVDMAAMQIGIFVAVAYMSFTMALYSIPRETNNIWLFRSLNIKRREFVISKFLANLFVSVPLSSGVFLGYVLLAKIIVDVNVVHLKSILQGYIWSIGTIIPLSIIWGIIIGALLPYKIMIKKQKITYKFNGLEGVVLTILIFVVVVPAFFVSQIYQYWAVDVSFVVYLSISFILMLYRAGKTYKRME